MEEVLNETQLLKIEYEDGLKLAVTNYKKASSKLEFAFDSYDEECIKEEMGRFRDEVKSFRSKIDELDTNAI